MVEMTEHELLAECLKSLTPLVESNGGVVIKHADASTAGIPDVSVTVNGRTSWWEFKHANPRVKGTELQRLTARRLANAGICWYVVYQTLPSGTTTHLVRPSAVGVNGHFQSDHSHAGIDHRFVVNFILERHAA